MILTRFASLPTGTIGRLEIPDGPTLYTIERPWLDNRPWISCIPLGEYPLEWDTTGRVRGVPRLRDTGPRTQINIHTANHPTELQGCIAPGLRWTVNDQAPKVTDSRAALALLLEHIAPQKYEDGAPMFLNGEPALLRIVSAELG